MSKALENLHVEDMEFAQIDHHRHKRQGFPEVICCPGKTPEQILRIAKSIIKKSNLLLGTKTDNKVYNRLKKETPEIKYDKAAKVIYLPRKKFYKEMDDRL